MQSDIVQRLQPILRRNGWGNVQEYARHIPFMLEREGLTIVETAEITRLTEALRAAEEREKGLRVKWAELHNTCNIVGSPYVEALQAVDRMVAHVRAVARAALKGPSHDA